jgi:hypothetical protein
MDNEEITKLVLVELGTALKSGEAMTATSTTKT